MKRAIAIAVVVALGGAAVMRTATGRAPTGDVPCVTAGATRFARRVTAEGNLRAVHGTPIVVPRIEGVWGPMKLAWEAQDGSVVKAGDTVVRFDRADAEKQLRETRVDLASADARLREAQLGADASIADHRQAAALAAQQADEIRRFRAKDPLLFSHNDIIEAELDERLAVARQLQAERALDSDRRVSRSSVDLAAINRQRATLALEHAEATLTNLEVRAPSDGILVLHRDDHGDLPKLGARLMPNEPLAEIPALDEMEAELFVLEVDGSGLEVDQPADVVVESRPDLVFHGVIRLVDKLAKPRRMWVPIQYFSVVVALERTERAVMKPGQRVHATLTLDRRNAIAVPRQAVFDKDGKTIVYRRGEHGFAPVAVELGAATPGRVAITSGLAEGDVIATRDPTQALDQPVAGGSGEPKGSP